MTEEFIPYSKMDIQPVGKIMSLRIWISEIPYNLAVYTRRLCRRLFWPKCDLCGKPAYYEHFGGFANCPCCEKGYGWIYVCWDCSFKHEGHGCVE